MCAYKGLFGSHFYYLGRFWAVRLAFFPLFAVICDYHKEQIKAKNPDSAILHKKKKPRTLAIPRLFLGAGSQTRTDDLRITNALLYRLSYTSVLSV